MKKVSQFTLFLALALLAGCGSNSSQGNPQTPGAPIDPSGNWSLTFTDAASHTLLISGLFSQTGSDVTALDILDAGNPAPFNCTGAMSMSNGQVLNVNQFSGDIAGGWGTLHFTSTLNAAGTHADGSYTLTPGSEGNCANVASTGTLTADEIPSVSGNWTGTVTCTANCPTGATQGTVAATLTQNDQTGVVSGTYTISGLPNISSGTIATGQFDVLSGASWQDSLTDNNGNGYAIAGGPFNGTAGLGLDRSFNGLLVELHDAGGASNAQYTVSMTH